MIKIFFKTAWRSLRRRRGFTILNILGLSVGIAAATLVALWVFNELSFDRFHKNAGRLYQVYSLTEGESGPRTAIDVVSQPLGPALKEQFPEVEAVSRMTTPKDLLVSVEERNFTKMKAAIVDPAFLTMFSFPLIEGSPAGQLNSANCITVTEDFARKLFDRTDIIGKVVRLNNNSLFTITGVLDRLPGNTRFDFDYLLPWQSLPGLAHGYVNDSWLSNNTMTFAMLKPGTDANSLSAKIRNLTRLHTGRSDVWTHFLHPLSKWRLYSAFKDGKVDGGRIATVRMFALIGLFILLIACVNFMNLSTARSEERSREVGVRKVAGAGRSSLVFQFLAEAFLITLFAGIAGMGIVQLALPGFNKLTDAGLAVPFGNISFWLCFVGFLLLTSALAGSYPALYLSSFRPAGIFKQAFRKTGSWFSPRKALVVFQFSIAIALIICTFVVRNQVQFAQTRDLGYENRGLLQVDFTGEIGKNYALISQELIASGNAISVTKTMSGITEGGSRSWGFRWANENPADTNIALTLYSADGNLVKTTGMQLVSGRDIDIDHYGSDSTAVLLNETAVRLMGFQDPIGQVLQQPHSGKTWQVVGVVKDYVQGSPYDLVPPTIIVGPAGWFNTMQIRLTPGRPVSTILSEMQKIFRKYNPSFPFEYAFSDDQFSRQFSDEQRTKTITGVFAALAIFISCLGLMGLSAYIAESRRKEIGVRKVLGASSMSITGLLSFDFLKLVMLALVIASPLAWYTMSRWLEDFAYRVHIGATTFIFAGGIAMAVTVIMIAVQTARAALANPVRSLRSQ